VNDDYENDDLSLDDDDRREYRGGGARRGGGGRRFGGRRNRVCNFCVDKVTRIDYKNYELLKRYIDSRGRILPRRQSGTCAKHQRAVAAAIKRARHVALLPFTAEHIHG
jgi:small subunit ribosomal protein S18